MIVRKMVLLFALLFAVQGQTAEAVRCGTDAFGNAICLDKDGVITPAPKESVGDRAGSDAKGGGASAGESGGKVGRDDKNGRARCGLDPFGNKVCR
jgi:hypothetical protein